MPNSRAPQKLELSAATTFPFTAIVGQDDMKLALVLHAIDPVLGGVLIMGHRGTAKSTAVRSLAELLPEISTVAGCPYRCDPTDDTNLCATCREKRSERKKLKSLAAKVEVVDLPLAATEDRVCGTIDIERALIKGKRSFEPGLLARANRGFLYIDEVNLLDDHLVDLLLDVSVTGVNRVERESVSVEHPARFVLIGSGNPEEGDLRPQLLDRFALHVEVKTETDLDRRVRIVERYQSFAENPYAFVAAYDQEQERLRNDIVRARAVLPSVLVGRDILRKIAELCAELNVDGHRGEITLTRAARALVALENRRKVGLADVKRVAPMSLRHRLRRQPFDEHAGQSKIEQAWEKISSGASAETVAEPTSEKSDQRSDSPGRLRTIASLSSSQPLTGNEAADIDLRASGPTQSRSTGSSNYKREPNLKRGRYSRAIRNHEAGSRIAVDATIRAIASSGGLITPDALRYKQFQRRSGLLYILLIDTSGSMAARRINRARDIAVGLLRRSYLNRDSISLIAFRGSSAATILSPTRSILRAKRSLDCLPVGGGTPLSAGLVRALETANRAGTSFGQPIVLLFTDGGGNVLLHGRVEADRKQRFEKVLHEVQMIGGELKKNEIPVVVITSKHNFSTSEPARLIAEELDAQFFER